MSTFLTGLKSAALWFGNLLVTAVIVTVLIFAIQKYCPFFAPKPHPAPEPVPVAPQVDTLEEAWKNDKDGEKLMHRDQFATFLEVAAQAYVPNPSLFKTRQDVFALLHTAAQHYVGNAMLDERKVLAAEWLALLKQDAEMTEADRKTISLALLQSAQELRKLK